MKALEVGGGSVMGGVWKDPEAEPPLLTRFDTGAVARADRLDYWRAAHPGTDIAPYRGRETEDGFHGAVDSLVAPVEETLLARTVTDPNKARFNDSAHENVMIGVLAGGEFRTPGPEGGVRVAAGQPYLIDLHRTDRFETTGFDNVFLSMPRTLAVQAMGEVPAPDSGLRLLPDTALGRIFQSHLFATVRELDGLTPPERTQVIDIAKSLAGTFLGQCAQAGRAEGPDDDAIVKAARQLMADSLHEPGITAGALARRMGYSRSRLYRAFERCGAGVMETLSEMRMQKALSLITLTAMPVSHAARTCGYTDMSAFSRAFRRAHGRTPRDCRRAAKAS